MELVDKKLVKKMNNSTIIQWFPGHMAKAKRLIKENIALVDLSIEIVDARIPQSSRNPDFEAILSRKPRVIALNKKDLADGEVTSRWIRYFREQGFQAAAINGAAKQGIKDLAAAAKEAAEPVMAALEAKGRRRRPVRAMVVGIPNVGKSTVINAMVDKTSAKTGDKPGLTRGTQWVRTVEGLDLLDTPGLLWPKFDDPETGLKLAFTGAVSDQVYSLEEAAKKLIIYLKKVCPQRLDERYKITESFDDPVQYLEMIGRKRGLLAPGGIVKTDQTALMLLQEFRSGKLGRYSLEQP